MSRLIQILLLLLSMLLVGAVGLHWLTGQPFGTCFYQAFILLTTVGSQEPSPLTDSTKVFIVLYLSCGLGLFAYSAFQFGQLLLNANFRAVLEKRRMEKKIDRLREHIIICGYGRMGRELASYLHQRNQTFVIIDEDEELYTPEMRQDDWMFVTGDATQDDVLRTAGVEHAKALTTVLPTDADNLYVVLSARLLASNLQIVARASDDRASHKMAQAGATRVINPLSSGAIRMARFMLSPSIENFVEVAESEGVDWEIADVHVPDDSPLVGMPLKDTNLRQSGIMLLGVCRSTGQKYFPPHGDYEIRPGDNLFAFGSSEDLVHLSNLLQPAAAAD